MKMRDLGRTSLMMGLLVFAVTAGLAAIQVEVNGQKLAFLVPPTMVQGRTMIPLRTVSESLGAQVDWNAGTRMITINSHNTNVRLGIGEQTAIVNGRAIYLDVPAMIQSGVTLVPLRFVGEALGADVRWFAATQTVFISTERQIVSDIITIPAATVIPVTLDRTLSSATSRRGDGVYVTVRSAQDGDAEFPRGTKLAGIVFDVQQKGAGQPGMLDLAFQEVQLPDGRKVAMTGSLISLDDRTVTQSADGRLVANDKTSSDRLKFVAIGTGAGLIIGRLLDKNLIVGGLLGAAAGFIFSEISTDKVQVTDVTVPAGTEFGVRIDRDLAYNVSPSYVASRIDYLNAP